MRKLISEEAIAEKVAHTAKEINTRFEGRTLTLIIVLKGAICFAADFMRRLTVPFEIEFVRAQSYGMKGTQPGPVTLIGTEEINLEGKDLLLIDDIFDTGATLQTLCKQLQNQKPRSLTTLFLLRKETSPKDIAPDYVLFDIKEHFVVGYGLDYREKYRGLKDICIWEKTT